MTGIVLIDKPAGFTSFDVVAKCRGIFRERRVGHSGTLDPMATGVLPVFLGKATKAISVLQDSAKGYTAEFRLGFSTDTQDTTGEITGRSGRTASRAQVEEALCGFVGRQLQLPPMYSAVKVNGKRLYKLARSGETVEREPREIEIYSIRLTAFDEKEQSGVIEVDCGAGTYIRTLINDLGERLGTLAAMSGLRRTVSQGFKIENCVTLAELQSAADCGEAKRFLLPLDSCFSEYRDIRLTAEGVKMYKDGKMLRTGAVSGLYRVYGPNEFLAIAKVEDGLMRPFKNFWEAEK